MSQDNSDASFAELFQETKSSQHQRLSPGQKISAQIADLAPETIFIDIGGKSEGILDRSEVDESEKPVAVGDELSVYFLRSTGSGMIFTTKIGGSGGAAHLEEAFQAQIPVEGMVKKEIKGGFEIMIGGSTRGFCPYSQMGLRRVENAAETFLDQSMTFLITRFEENGRNLVLSARAIQEREREELKEQLKETLAEGQTVTGTITSIREFGLFVDLGGVDGLVPLSELGWSRVDNVEELFTAGDQVKVLIKALDWEKDRITLSIKETLENPWDQAVTNFPIGITVMGRVARLTNFGAFVTLTPGVDGLLHISKIGGGRRINHPREVLEEGQDLEVQVDEIDLEKRNIRLSLAGQESVESETKTRATVGKRETYEPMKPQAPKSMGTFGDLLAASMKKKK
ncbi:MAG: 30S ribosomal protein S1 [Desulfobulbaceae bacterium]|uniref:30S ribosomal protein S1 n=1 Tax=Candidatus Desulfatifera sulfidica TaxID=2841691 RepID=A0A8J6NBS7_9BACT|nr:30S ribosomal protein S1 [Candidatus Desulfatifera sulfidica]